MDTVERLLFYIAKILIYSSLASLNTANSGYYWSRLEEMNTKIDKRFASLL